MMKFLFTFPPQWYPSSPYLSTALLAGQLKHAGFEAHTRDLNIEFFNSILTKGFIKDTIKKTKSISITLQADADKHHCDESDFFSLPVKVQTNLLRHKKIAEYYTTDSDKSQMVLDNIDYSLNVLKTKELFYKPELLFKAKDVLKEALRVISLPYSPTEILMDNYIANPLLRFDYNEVKSQCYDKSINMFIDFFQNKIDSVLSSDFDFIGISIIDLSQLIPGLTLARMLKEKTNAHISLGGNYISKIEKELVKFPEVFDIFCDSLSVGDGEKSCVELARHLNGEIPIEQVHSLIYKDKANHIIVNETAPLLNMNEIHPPSFDDFDFSKYLSPEIVMPMQLSKGCYWGKCTFCDFYTGQQSFDIKSPSTVIAEMKEMIEKHGIKHFLFVDEAIPPDYYNKLALEIIESKLTVFFYSFVRLETGFSREVLQNLYNAGARIFMWGYEAESPRIMKLINKGVDVDKRKQILQTSHDLGLWNHVTFLFGYPTETNEEIQQTMDFIRNNRDIVNSCTPSNFALKKNSIIMNHTKKFGIKKFKDNGDFHISCSDEVADGITMSERKKIRYAFQQDFLNETAKYLWTLNFSDSDHMLLYLSIYNADWVNNYQLTYCKDS